MRFAETGVALQHLLLFVARVRMAVVGGKPVLKNTHGLARETGTDFGSRYGSGSRRRMGKARPFGGDVDHVE